jgi:hypothetical protein
MENELLQVAKLLDAKLYSGTSSSAFLPKQQVGASKNDKAKEVVNPLFNSPLSKTMVIKGGAIKLSKHVPGAQENVKKDKKYMNNSMTSNSKL